MIFRIQFFAVLFQIIFLTFSVQAYSGGTGTEADPYQIANKADLLYLGASTSHYSKHFILTADIDLAGETFSNSIIAGNSTSGSIYYGTSFSGSFNGNGHVIRNLTVKGASDWDYLGLFGYFNTSGIIKKLGLEDVNISGSGSSIGGICGKGRGTISECYSSGSVSASSHVGGICGYNYDGNLINCHSSVKVNGGFTTGGGLCGYTLRGSIVHCYSMGSVPGDGGGLVGINSSSSPATITGCFWDINTSGRTSSGGGVGKTTAEMQSILTFLEAGWDFTDIWQMDGYPVLSSINSGGSDVILSEIFISGPAVVDENKSANYSCTAVYSNGSSSNVTDKVLWSENSSSVDINASGLLTAQSVDSNQSVVLSASFTDGSVTKTNTFSVTVRNFIPLSITISGLDSINENSTSSYICVASYSDGSSSNVTMNVTWSDNSDFAEIDAGGLLTVQNVDSDSSLTISASYTFGGLIKTDTHEVLIKDLPGGSLFSGGSGTEAAPYQISSKADLLYLAAHSTHYSDHFILTSNIDLTGEIFSSAVIAPDIEMETSGFQGTQFTGSFDGNGYSIINMVIDASVDNKDFLGLFGYIGQPGLVENLALVNILITGGASSVKCGAVCGYSAYTVVRNCWSTGNVFGYEYLGGLCGGAVYGVVSNCFSHVSVCCSNNGAGGMLGVVGFQKIANCYSAGSVTGGLYQVGGLCGFVGRGSSVVNCFWDMDASGLTTSAAGTGKTTSEMQMQSTFTDAGWDFVTETENGTNDVWYMKGYPLLRVFSDSELNVKIVGISIFGPDGLNEGGSAVYSCFAVYSDGSTSNVTADVSWSEDSDFASIDTNGVLIVSDVPSNQCVIISAVYTNGAINVSDTHNVSVKDIPTVILAAIEISGPSVLNEESFSNYTCTASYSDGSSSNVTAKSVWSENSNFAEITTNGLLVTYSIDTDQEVVVSALYTDGGVTKTNSLNVTVKDVPVVILYSGGSGTAAAPYQIANKADLLYLRSHSEDYGKHFIVTADIDLAGVNFSGAVIAPDTGTTGGFQGTSFSGVFDGGYHRISNITITSTGGQYMAFFGHVGASGAVVQNLCVENLNITGSSISYNLGGLCGYTYMGSFISCYVTGSIIGGTHTAGLCGENNSGSFTKCFSDVTVNGGSNCGGVCGHNLCGTFIDCYAQGNVTGGGYVGGFWGYSAFGTITRCFSTGAVAGDTNVGGFGGNNYVNTVNNCFWDTQTSLQSTSNAGIGKTTAELKTQSFFIDAGWDFVVETVNGIKDVWYMDGYPNLACFNLGASYYALTVVNGSGSAYLMDGMVVPVTADPAPVRQMFSTWQWTPEIYTGLLTDVSSPSTTLLMPPADLTLTAVYINALQYDVTFDPGEHRSRTGGGLLDQRVYHGEDAVEPVLDLDADWIFNGWDGCFLNITSNTSLTATYLPAVTSLVINGSDFVNELSNEVYTCTAFYADGSCRGVSTGVIWSINQVLPGIDFNEGALVLQSITNGSQVVISAQYSENGVLQKAQKVVDLIDFEYSGGSGNLNDPYLVASKADLLQLSATSVDYDKTFLLIDDIDLSGQTNAVALISSSASSIFFSGAKFTGSFFGCGHTIRNFVIDSSGQGPGFLGLFGYLGRGAVVSDLILKDAIIMGKPGASDYVGAICGCIDNAVISNCFVEASVFGDDYIGGICGLSKNGQIFCSATRGSVQGNDFVGGVCAYASSGAIYNSYSTAAVKGDRYVGGFAGCLYLSKVLNCYSSGYVVGVSCCGGFAGRVLFSTAGSCFWDAETSGIINSAGGTGKTTAEMQTQSTFTDAGWDFSDTWYVDRYPVLRCFISSGTYESWLMDAGIPAGLRGSTNAPASDNIANLLKYACGLPAMDSCTTADLMTVEPVTSNCFSILYFKSKTATDVTLQPIWAQTLAGPWSVLGLTTEKISEDADREQWKASVPVGDSGFIKLRVTQE